MISKPTKKVGRRLTRRPTDIGRNIITGIILPAAFIMNDIKTHKKGGPPPHAPAYGYRAKYNYRYYPASSVYYDMDRGLYFYLEGPDWQISASLPHAIQVGLGDHVVLEMEADKPYIHYDEHKHKYPPGQFKNKHKKVKNKKYKKFG
jgi:hypothetical protein